MKMNDIGKSPEVVLAMAQMIEDALAVTVLSYSRSTSPAWGTNDVPAPAWKALIVLAMREYARREVGFGERGEENG